MGAISRQHLVEIFVEVADTLVDAFDLIEFLTLVTERAAELAGSAASGLLLSDDGGHLQFMAASSESARVVELFQVQREEGPCQECFQDGASVSHGELESATTRWPNFAPRALEAGFHAVHAFPLRHRQTVIGALNLFDAMPREFSGSDASVLQALADVASIGILQERSIRGERALTEQLQRALNTRVTIEQAKGALAHVHSVTPDVAFDMLRQYSRTHHHGLTEVAASVLDNPASHPDLTAARK